MSIFKRNVFSVIAAVIVLFAAALFTYVAPAGAATATPQSVAAFQYIEHVDGLNHIFAIIEEENQSIPLTDVEKALAEGLAKDATAAIEAHDYVKADDLIGQLIDLAYKVAKRADDKSA